MKVECEIWEAKNGIVTAVKIDDTIFVAVKEADDVQNNAEIETSNITEIKKRKHKRHHKPADSIWFSKTYSIWVKKSDSEIVSRALKKWNFKATVNNIMNETRLPQSRVRATLEYLVSKGEAYYNTEILKRGGIVKVYYPSNGKTVKINYP